MTDEKLFSFTDLGALTNDAHRLVEAILDGDAETAIDLLCEDFPALVSYQHQVRLHAAIKSARFPERKLADDILAELVRARTKFPGKNVTFAALVEEVGELATATFEEGRERVRKEAVQVAVMAMRMVLDGDHTFDDWRKGKGLDALTEEMAA